MAAALVAAGLSAGAVLALVLPHGTHIQATLTLGERKAASGALLEQAAGALEAQLSGLRLTGARVLVGVSPTAAEVTLEVHAPWWGPGRKRLLAELDDARRRLRDDAAARSRQLLEELAATQISLDDLQRDRQIREAWHDLATPVATSVLTESIRWLEAETHLAEERLRRFHSRQSELISEWIRLKDPVDADAVPVDPRDLAAAERGDEMLVRDRRQLDVLADEADRFLGSLNRACQESLGRVREELTGFNHAVRENDTEVGALQNTSRVLAGLLESYEKELADLTTAIAESREDGSAAPRALPPGRIRARSQQMAAAVDNWTDGATGIRHRVAELVERMADGVPERTPAIVLQNTFQQRVHRLTRAHEELAAAAGALIPARNHQLDGQLRSLAGLERRVEERAELVRQSLRRKVAAAAETERQRNLTALEPRIAALPPDAFRRIEGLFALRDNQTLVSSMRTAAQRLDHEHRTQLHAAELEQRQLTGLDQNLAALLAQWSASPVVRLTGVDTLSPPARSLAAQWVPAALAGGFAFVICLGLMAWWDAARLAGRQASTDQGVADERTGTGQSVEPAPAPLSLVRLPPAAPGSAKPSTRARPSRRRAAR